MRTKILEPAPLHHRSADSFAHAKQIQLPYGEIEQVLHWCRGNLRSDTWRWQMIEPSSPARQGRYCFFMDDDEDFTAFLLKWS